jgi:hypothetical protein
VVLCFKSSAQVTLKGKLSKTSVSGIYKMTALHQADPKNPSVVVCLDHFFEAGEVAQMIVVNEGAQPRIVKPQAGILIPS